MSAMDLPRAARTELLRFITCGSVDDGKSTLIGRLLYDSKAVLADQLAAVERSSRRRGSGHIDLSLLTDGLQAEREQGITIDVAYRYFATPRRTFIIADTPGHEQYTRNMVTGASTADLAVILLDARKGVLTQSRRHAYLASLLGIPHLVVAVNKMDLADYAQDVFERLREAFLDFATPLGFADIRFIPVSALRGDMVVERGGNLPWYRGETLLETLENIRPQDSVNLADFRFPVQLVARHGLPAEPDYRGYLGRIESGVVQVGDPVLVLPTGVQTRVRAIGTFDGALTAAGAGQSVTLTLEDQVDVSRGDMIAGLAAAPQAVKSFEAMLCWFAHQSLDPNRNYLVRHCTRSVPGRVSGVDYRINVNTLEREPAGAPLAMNQIAKVTLRTGQPVVADAYARNRATGSFILVDELSNDTVAAGMIL